MNKVEILLWAMIVLLTLNLFSTNAGASRFTIEDCITSEKNQKPKAYLHVMEHRKWRTTSY